VQNDWPVKAVMMKRTYNLHIITMVNCPDKGGREVINLPIAQDND